MPRIINHALVLNLHQPLGNLELLLDTNEWEAKEILWSMDRMPRKLWAYEDRARVHLSLSGTLLQTLKDKLFQERVYGIVQCGDLLWHLQNEKIFDILGTGYFHPVLPLIPKIDCDEQLERWRGIGEEVFSRNEFSGFWPPEMSFSMELIPLIKKMGYQYVLVDSNNVEAVTDMSWAELRYRPHVAKFGGEEIIVVVRDRDLSDAQESGMDVGWFLSEVEARTKDCDFVPLVTTCTDGDNGGWFRNTTENSNYWDCFYEKLLQNSSNGNVEVEPIFIKDYLKDNEPFGEVRIDTAAWNTGWHHGKGFLQWTGSQVQKEALTRLEQASAMFHDRANSIRDSLVGDEVHLLAEAHFYMLKAQTSCHFFWGESWVHYCHEDIDRMEALLSKLPNGRV